MESKLELLGSAPFADPHEQALDPCAFCCGIYMSPTSVIYTAISTGFPLISG